MIIACPACATRYVVPDTAIGVDGRTVRCAKCRHSWFQDGPGLDTPEQPANAQAAVPQEAPAPPVTAPTPTTPPVQQPDTSGASQAYRSDPSPGFAAFAEPAARAEVASQAAFQSTSATDVPADATAYAATLASDLPPPVPATAAPPSFESDGLVDDYSQFDASPPFRPRRNPLRLWTYAAAIFASVAVGTVVAVSYWGLPDWVPISRPTFGLGQSDLVLDFPNVDQPRRKLPNGTEFFNVSGTVTNVGSVTRNLPAILIVLRDGRDRIVFSWEVAPPQHTLAPGESVTINEAMIDVPRAAKFAEIGWKPN